MELAQWLLARYPRSNGAGSTREQQPLFLSRTGSDLVRKLDKVLALATLIFLIVLVGVAFATTPDPDYRFRKDQQSTSAD
jgi:hypothetical protein